MDSAMDLQAVVAGHTCLDITPGFKDTENKKTDELFLPGKTIMLSGINMSTGGAVSNTGIALLMLGISTCLMGKVGKDYFGDIVINILKKYGAEKDVKISEEVSTSYSIALSPPGIDRIILHEQGANDTFNICDINFDIVKNSRLFHLGYPTTMRKMFMDDGNELVNIFKKVKSYNVTTSMDTSLFDENSEAGKANWKCILKRVLPFVDIFTPSFEELFSMLRHDEYIKLNKASKGLDMIDVIDMDLLRELGEELLDMGVKIAVIKCGKKGFYIRTGDSGSLSGMGRALPADPDNWSGRELFEEAFHVDRIESTLGAGDTSIAGFLASFLTGKTIEESIKIACAAGALCTQTRDAVSGMKSLDEIASLINKGWTNDKILLNSAYWNYNDVKKVWAGNKDSKLIKA